MKISGLLGFEKIANYFCASSLSCNLIKKG